MPRYEFEFGVFVDADNEKDAWAKVRIVSEHLDKIDAEGDSTVEGPILVPEDEALPG